jgi:hypothetical protein
MWDNDHFLIIIIIIIDSRCCVAHRRARGSERTGKLLLSLVDAIAGAGLFRLWIPRALGGEEVDAISFIEVVEATCYVLLCNNWRLLSSRTGGREIYGSDARVAHRLERSLRESIEWDFKVTAAIIFRRRQPTSRDTHL